MTAADFVFPFLLVALVFALCLGLRGCLLLPVVEDEFTGLRRRVNDLELRVYRIELKTKIGGEVANGK